MDVYELLIFFNDKSALFKTNISPFSIPSLNSNVVFLFLYHKFD